MKKKEDSRPVCLYFSGVKVNESDDGTVMLTLPGTTSKFIDTKELANIFRESLTTAQIDDLAAQAFRMSDMNLLMKFLT